MNPHLSQCYSASPAQSDGPEPRQRHGSLLLTVHTGGADVSQPLTLCYTSLARVDEYTEISGARLKRCEGSFVELELPHDLPANTQHTITLTGLAYGASNRAQGVRSAWLSHSSGLLDLTLGDLDTKDGVASGTGVHWPDGQVTTPLGLLPHPAEVAVSAWRDAPVLHPAEGADTTEILRVAKLHRRLYPYAAAPLSVVPMQNSLALGCHAQDDLPAGAYRLEFGGRVDVYFGDVDGLRHALIALAQMSHHARTDRRYRFPASGTITDAPRFAWRGLMFDVARNFFGVSCVMRLLDIMAWLRMNHLHWHLTDDEGWRMPSRAYPDLNRMGATRGIGCAIAPQYGDRADGQRGFYSEADVADVLAYAQRLGIAVMPEVEMPSHALAILSSIPGLRDPDEPELAYRSVQGHANNALNPALEKSYVVARTLLDEAIELFPFDTVHVGADELEWDAWAQSPACQALAQQHGLAGSRELQAYFLRHVQAHLASRGRSIAAWDEAAEGGGIHKENALLFAWRSKQRVAELIEQGYAVVASPGQAYYLDMVASEGWDACGISWAGVSTPEQCYRYEVDDDLPSGPGRLLGVQAGLWTEYLRCRADINNMAFPRLAAVAEAAWTPAAQKDWHRFCALSHHVPQL